MRRLYPFHLYIFVVSILIVRADDDSKRRYLVSDDNDSGITRLKPKIQIAVPVHPYSKAKILPFTLSAIESQEYPKERIKVFIYFDLYKRILDDLTHLNGHRDSQLDERYVRNLLSYEVITAWITANKKKYKDIQLIIRYLDDSDEALQDSVDYWTEPRFRRIIELKTLAMRDSINNWADYLFLIDSDVVLTINKTLTRLVDARKPLIAPLLYSLNTYSNFWAGMNEKGYYVRTDDYYPILEGHKLGTFKVPMIHSCILMDLNIEEAGHLTFDNSLMSDVPYDDIITFAISAKRAGIPMYLMNEVWGYMMLPTRTMNLSTLDQDLTDLRLEAIDDKHTFPISPSLVHFTNRLNPLGDKLGVDEVYVINLKRRPERLKSMLEKFNVLGIDAQVVTATDGKNISEKELEVLGVKPMPDYLDPFHKRPITFGEIGCFLSHYRVWQEMVSKNYERVIVFEDDVQFERHFRSQWFKRLKALDNLPSSSQPDFVYLGRKPLASKEEKLAPIDGFAIPEYSYWTIGYMISNQAASFMLRSEPLKNILPIDEFLPIMFSKHPRTDWMRYFSIAPINAWSVHPLLISPTHYVGDEQYISDTEQTDKIKVSNSDLSRSKHNEL